MGEKDREEAFAAMVAAFPEELRERIGGLEQHWCFQTLVKAIEAAYSGGYAEGIEAAAARISEYSSDLWPEGVSFVQDTKRHAAINAAAWVRALSKRPDGTDAAEPKGGEK